MVEYQMEALVSTQGIEFTNQLLSESLKECYRRVILDYSEIIDWLNSINPNVTERSPLHYKLFLENIIMASIAVYHTDFSILMELLEYESELQPDFKGYFDTINVTIVEYVLRLATSKLETYIDNDKDTQIVLGGWISDTTFVVYLKEEEDVGAYYIQQLLF